MRQYYKLLYALLKQQKNVLMYIHRASELANFVKHITKAFEFLVVKKQQKNQYKMHCLHSSSDDF